MRLYNALHREHLGHFVRIMSVVSLHFCSCMTMFETSGIRPIRFRTAPSKHWDFKIKESVFLSGPVYTCIPRDGDDR